jgi:hypothetical protein
MEEQTLSEVWDRVSAEDRVPADTPTDVQVDQMHQWFAARDLDEEEVIATTASIEDTLIEVIEPHQVPLAMQGAALIGFKVGLEFARGRYT